MIQGSVLVEGMEGVFVLTVTQRLNNTIFRMKIV